MGSYGAKRIFLSYCCLTCSLLLWWHHRRIDNIPSHLCLKWSWWVACVFFGGKTIIAGWQMQMLLGWCWPLLISGNKLAWPLLSLLLSSLLPYVRHSYNDKAKKKKKKKIIIIYISNVGSYNWMRCINKIFKFEIRDSKRSLTGNCRYPCVFLVEN